MIWAIAISLAILLGMILPFLPGQYDPLAVAISTTVQLLAAASLLLVPIGLVWWTANKTSRAASDRPEGVSPKPFYFAYASLVMGTILVFAVALIVMNGISASLGLILFLLGGLAFRRVTAALRHQRATTTCPPKAIPVYLVVLPLLLFLAPMVVAVPLTEYSRNRAIRNSQNMIADIERYHVQRGEYPESLAAMWKDYYPGIMGIDKYHYAPHDRAYNLFFEQPRFVFDNMGTREWVVYHPSDQQRMYSHTSWFLLLAPDQLERSQGWYAVHDAGVPRWKYFWFD